MHENNVDNNKFTWNDFIVIKNDAPNQFHPGEIGVICGISKIESDEMAKKYHSSVGSWIYTIEFNNGSDIQVAESFLEIFKNTNSKNNS
jgi:hypothetical protein